MLQALRDASSEQALPPDNAADQREAVDVSVPSESQESRAADAAAALLRRLAGARADSSMESVAKLLDATTPAEPRRRRTVVEAADALEVSGSLRFNLNDEILEVPAYGEIYGLHPREFVFDRDGSLLPAAGPHGFNSMASVLGDVEGNEDDESDDDSEHWVWSVSRSEVSESDAGVTSGGLSSMDEEDEDEEWASLLRDLDAQRLDASLPTFAELITAY